MIEWTFDDIFGLCLFFDGGVFLAIDVIDVVFLVSGQQIRFVQRHIVLEGGTPSALAYTCWGELRVCGLELLGEGEDLLILERDEFPQTAYHSYIINNQL